VSVRDDHQYWTVSAIVRATLPLLLALTMLELGAGLALEGAEATLLRYPSLLILVPVTIGTAGNLGSVLAARLSTAFHLGLLSFAPDDEALAGNSIAAVAVALTVFPGIGAGAWLLATVTGGARLPWHVVVLIATISGAIMSVLAVGVTIAATYGAYRLEIDPDDVAIPLVTNVADVLGVLVLLGVVVLTV
jgi:mgtE-like transporter